MSVMKKTARKYQQFQPTFTQLQSMLDGLKLKHPEPCHHLPTQPQTPSTGQDQSISLISSLDHISNYSSVIQDNLEDETCFEEETNIIDIKALNRSLIKSPINYLCSEKSASSESSTSRTSHSFRKVRGTSGIIQKFNKHLEKISTDSKPLSSECKQNKAGILNLAMKAELKNRKFFSGRVQMHKFSDYKQLLRDAQKK